MSVLINRIPRRFEKTVTFDGGTVSGAIAQETIATVSGAVLLLSGGVHCSTLLTGASATISLGTANNVAGLIDVTTATDIDANDMWRDNSPEVEIQMTIEDRVIQADMTIDVLTATIDTGVLQFLFWWLPVSLDGNMV